MHAMHILHVFRNLNFPETSAIFFEIYNKRIKEELTSVIFKEVSFIEHFDIFKIWSYIYLILFKNLQPLVQSPTAQQSLVLVIRAPPNFPISRSQSLSEVNSFTIHKVNRASYEPLRLAKTSWAWLLGDTYRVLLFLEAVQLP